MANAHPDEAPPAAPESAVLTSVDNALWLLQLIGERQALRVAEAAELLGVARSTAHRLLTALRRREFVMQDRPNGAYRPGPALNAVGLAAISLLDIRRFARPVLERLQEHTHETVTLALLEGTAVRFVDCVESTRSVRVGNRTGVVRPAHASAVGKAMLAQLPGWELHRRYPDAILPAGTPTAIADRTLLEQELARIRGDGFAVNWEESVEGVGAIAVSVNDVSGVPLAGLGIAAPSSRLGASSALHKYAPTLQAAAATISERMRNPR